MWYATCIICALIIAFGLARLGYNIGMGLKWLGVMINPKGEPKQENTVSWMDRLKK